MKMGLLIRFKSVTSILEITLISLFTLYLPHAANGQTQARISSLYSSLMSNYSTNAVPRTGDEPIKVNITFYLMSLVRFDETEETLVSAAWLSLSWRDQFLTWSENPDFENITDIYLKQKEIWRPDILLLNTVEDYELLGADDRLVEVTSEGEILWEPGHRFRSACSPNINHYPFDTQECELQFSTWTHIDSIVNFKSETDEIFLDDFEENGEWEIIKSSAKCRIFEGEGYSLSQFIVTVTLQRRRTYYVLTVCVPVMVLSMLNCLVYLLPPESGEKMTFCLTTLLAFMVYISFLSDNLPRTSKTISYLLIYLSIMIGISFLSVMNSVIVLLFWHRTNIAGNDDDGVKDDNEEATDAKEKQHSGETSAKRGLFNFIRNLLANKTQVYPLRGPGAGHSNETSKVYWKAVAKQLDKILLICVISLIVIASIVVFALLLSP